MYGCTVGSERIEKSLKELSDGKLVYALKKRHFFNLNLIGSKYFICLVVQGVFMMNLILNFRI